ncbi:MAG TPA: hypothetical protein IAB86_01410 [Candidatus Aphodovivens avicola]|nr:hypothetical protein [Candidatus Aphodovivens avicola]
MTGDNTAITSATTMPRAVGSSTAHPTSTSTFATTTPRMPWRIVRARRQFHSLDVRNVLITPPLA